VYYKANVQPRIFAYYRTSSGIWTYWASAQFTASPTSWSRATWATPALPSGATNISVGMGLSVVGSVTMDDFALFDDAPPPDTTAPTTTINCNGGAEPTGCAGGWYADAVSVELSAVDDAGGSGVKEIRYTTDGSDPTAATGTLYNGPFSVMSTTTVKYRAFDNAGNAETVKSQQIRIDTTAPSVRITAPVDGATVTGSVKITTATSDVDSGVARVSFYVDGVLLTTATTSPYSTQWVTKKTTKGRHTLTAVARDNAGNQTTSAAVGVTVA
jgi:hypothetical protein